MIDLHQLLWYGSSLRKANFLSAQGKEVVSTGEAVTVFTPEEIEKFRGECFRCWGTGKRIYQQSAATIFMLNTGLRTGEMLGLLNRDVDLEHRVLHVRQAVKEIYKREGTEATSGREVTVGRPKSTSSRRDVPLNDTAVAMALELRQEFYFGVDSPFVPDENGSFTRPVNFRKRYYRILEAAGIEQKGLHSLRHTFAINLVNGVKQEDGTIKSLTPRQVADLLGCCVPVAHVQHRPSRQARTQHQPDHGDVLCEERHQPVGRRDRWI